MAVFLMLLIALCIQLVVNLIDINGLTVIILSCDICLTLFILFIVIIYYYVVMVKMIKIN